MNPVAFNIFGFSIMWYAVLIMLGVIIGLRIAKFNTRRADLNINYDDIIDTFLYAFPLGIIGARIYYVIFSWDNYKDDLLQILNIRGGGLAIHGGLLGAAVGVILYKTIKKKSWKYMLDMVDAAAPGIIIAQALGRWGNFMNSEAHGGPVTEEFISIFPKFIQDGMSINGQYYHPTFLYESMWNLLMGIVLIGLFQKRANHHEGTILAWYGILYSIGRFFIEGLRTDSLMVGGLRTAQMISLLFILLGVLYLVWKYSRQPRPATPEHNP